MDGSHPVALKVMRVSRPSLSSAWEPSFTASPPFLARATSSMTVLQGPEPLAGHPTTLRDLSHASPLLSLPSSFGAVQLGETFTSCLCLNNEAEGSVENVSMKVEMQTATSKVILAEVGGDSGITLIRGSVVETIVRHEIKEIGQHVLACIITYQPPRSAHDSHSKPLPSQSFSKYYKFSATNPLSVKTKVHTPRSPTAAHIPEERDKVFLEVHVQNLTSVALWFESIQFQPVEGLAAFDANEVAENRGSIPLPSGERLGTTIVQPKDVRQFVYILSPVTFSLFPEKHTPGSMAPLGRLDISWRSEMGEPGRLLTSMLYRRIPALQIGIPQTALPPHMQKSQSPRPSSPRPGSPFSPRQSTHSSRPSSPALPPLPTEALQESESVLLVRACPHSVVTRHPFSIDMTVAIRLPEEYRTEWKMFVQHIRPSQSPNEGTIAELASILNSPESSSSQRRLSLTDSIPERAEVPSPRNSAHSTSFPKPYDNELPDVLRSSGVHHLGSSVVPLLDPVLPEQSAPHERRWDFKLHYVATRSGMASIGGLRAILVKGPPHPDHVVIKRWDVFAEVWVSAY